MERFVIDPRDSVTIIRISDKDLGNYEVMRGMHEELALTLRQSRTRNILVDLHDAAFLTSEMLGQLIQMVQRSKSAGVSIKFCRPNSAIRDVMRIIWFDKLAAVLDTKQEALQAFRRESDSANQNYQSPEAQQEVADLRQRAEQGDAAAQYRLGWCLENGFGVEQDSQAAFRMYSLAANQSFPEALLALATFHAYAITVPQDYDAATRLYRQAAELGLPDAQYAVGMNYDFGIGVPEDRDAAIRWYQRAADQGHERAQEALQAVLK